VSKHIFHNNVPCPPTPFKAGFGWLFIPCLVGIWPACQEVELCCKQVLLACQEVLQQALQTSFEATISRYGLRHWVQLG